METIQIRASASLPLPDDQSQTTNNHIIVFKHPAYPDEYEQNILLQLYAWDSPNGGLHAGTALLACALVACNAWNGYLTIERDGPRLELQDDDVLPGQAYYFHVPTPSTTSVRLSQDSSCYKYPVYPSFRHWAFPHRNIPTSWIGQSGTDSFTGAVTNTPSVSSVSAAVINRDRSCIVSSYRDYIERAHLCPRHELDWFRKNGMRRYNARLDISGDFITDDIANALAMRADIHRAFDDCKFILTRKRGEWAIHFLEQTYDLGRMYHNQTVKLVGVSPEFLLARFAWAIFPLVKAFVEQGPERVVKVREQHAEGIHEVVKTLDPAGFERMNAITRERSNSPKKRKTTEAPLPLPETKRVCVSIHTTTIASRAPPPDSILRTEEGQTPGLSFNDDDSTEPNDNLENSSDLRPEVAKQDLGTEDDAETDRMTTLRMDGLRKQRPQDRSLICCDYNMAEQANALRVPGRPEYGGGHLCEWCLGLEA